MDTLQEIKPVEAPTASALNALQRLYIFREAERVKQFLREHLDLVSFLPEAYVQVEKYFGPKPQIALEVVRDPEIVIPDELFGYIITPLSVEEALSRLHNLDKGWYLNQADWVRNDFIFDVDFA